MPSPDGAPSLVFGKPEERLRLQLRPYRCKHVASWHFSDMAQRALHVRYWGQRGSRNLTPWVGRTSLSRGRTSENDPKPKGHRTTARHEDLAVVASSFL